MRLRCPTGERIGGGKRGANRLRQTRQSRQRQTERALNYPGSLCWFVVLTLPKEYVTDGRFLEAKLEAWVRWFRREEPGWDLLWKKEFQHRGAWHVHILLGRDFGGDPLEVVWPRWKEAREKWWLLVGSGDRHHRKRGLHAERVKGERAARWYLLKYLSKDDEQTQVPDGWTGVGRWWGCCDGWRRLAKSTEEVYELTQEEATQLARTMRRAIGGSKALLFGMGASAGGPKGEDFAKRRQDRWKWANGRRRSEKRHAPWSLDGLHGFFSAGHAREVRRLMYAWATPRVVQVE